ncbi:MAG: transglutaminase domain-containing protein, partial [Oscillospiraceae bacterium]|nr:transglutaminase domain-containing protein [Oscillospiraceae bacterium]
VIGYAEPNIYHAWNEVYTEETGWITPELFLKKKGYNLTDATFYASNSDKEKIAGYISDDKNYAAMYRY